MSEDFELAKEAIRQWMRGEAKKNNDDYDFNPDKVDVMNDIIALCQEITVLFPNCNIVRCAMEPKDIQGAIELLVEDELAMGNLTNNIAEFKRIVEMADGVNIEPFGDDYFHITFFVDDLYVKKKV